jgi:hypothetical protein
MSEECCICYESMGNKNTTTTACGHKFCFSCIMKCMDEKNACPCCRAPLREDVEEDNESLINPFDDDDWSYDGLDFDVLESTNNPTNGLVSVQEIMDFVKEENISLSDVLSYQFSRYDSGDESTLKEKYVVLEDFVRSKDRERRQECDERLAMMGEDVVPKLSLTHPDLLETIDPIPYHQNPRVPFVKFDVNMWTLPRMKRRHSL